MLYKLPDETQQHEEYQNHENVLPRIISSPRSREVASDYIQGKTFEDKIVITRILNEWNKETFPTQELNSVIRPEAVPVIKDWLNNAQDREVTIAKDLLAHLSDQKKRSDDVQQRNSPRGKQTSAWRGRPASTASRQGSRPVSTDNGRRSSAANQPKRPTLRPRTGITYGSFYPQQQDGFGNNTGVFNIVRGQARPKTMASKAQQYREKYHNKEQESPRAPIFNPVNRSGVFGAVIRPVPQDTFNLDGSFSTQQIRPGTRQSRPSSQAQGRRPATQGQLQKQNSDEKLKFSANLQNNSDDFSQVETDRSEDHQYEAQQREQTYCPSLDKYKDLGLHKHWPGRPYHNTNLLLC